MKWLPIPGYEGYYEVSDLGIVRSVPRHNHRGAWYSGRILRMQLNMRGYLQVSLSKHGRCRNRLVHQLVLTAFAGRRPRGKEARHLNGIKTDCRAVNLKWGTRSENRLDIVRHKRERQAAPSRLRGTHWDKTSRKWVARIHYDGRSHFLGHFPTDVAAHRAYIEVAEKIGRIKGTDHR